MTRTKQRQFWAEAVEEYKASGQKQAAWCRAYGIQPNQLRYWLSKEDRDEKEIEEMPSPEWVSVQVACESPVHGQYEASITMQIGAVRIEVYPGFHPELLAAVVKVLSQL